MNSTAIGFSGAYHRVEQTLLQSFYTVEAVLGEETAIVVKQALQGVGLGSGVILFAVSRIAGIRAIQGGVAMVIGGLLQIGLIQGVALAILGKKTLTKEEEGIAIGAAIGLLGSAAIAEIGGLIGVWRRVH